jgi:hypothetical protein
LAGTPLDSGDSSTFADVTSALDSYQEDDDQSEQDTQPAPSDQPVEQDQSDADEGEPELSLDDGTEELADEDQGDPEETPQNTGQFTSHDAKVRLDDGTVTTVGEVIRGTLRNADYTRGKTELAQARQEFDGMRQQVRQQYETVQQHQQRLAQIASALLPRRPDPSMMQTDLVGYNVMLDAYNRTVEMMQGLDADYQNTVQVQEQERDYALQSFREQQADELVKRDPKFADDNYYRTFWQSAVDVGGRVYGYTQKELADGMNDHRQYLVLRDALAYQRLLAQQRKTKGKGNGQRFTPANGRGRQPLAVNGRPNNQQQAQRRIAQERFSKNPSIKNALDLID